MARHDCPNGDEKRTSTFKAKCLRLRETRPRRWSLYDQPVEHPGHQTRPSCDVKDPVESRRRRRQTYELKGTEVELRRRRRRHYVQKGSLMLESRAMVNDAHKEVIVPGNKGLVLEHSTARARFRLLRGGAM